MRAEGRTRSTFVEILNGQGGNSFNIEKGGVSPTLRSQTHGNPTITVYTIQDSMIGRTDRDRLQRRGPPGKTGINKNIFYSQHYRLPRRLHGDRAGGTAAHVVTALLYIGTGQANADTLNMSATQKGRGVVRARYIDGIFAECWAGAVNYTQKAGKDGTWYESSKTPIETADAPFDAGLYTPYTLNKRRFF